MSTPEAGPLPALTSRRERVLELLSKHFASGHIELDDLERRMEIAARAVGAAELETALSGLTAPQPAAAPSASAAVERPGRGLRRSVAFLAGHRRVGRWYPPRLHRAVAVLGGMQLDYREAVLEDGEAEIDLFVMFGGVQLIVPPEMDVEVDGSAFLGGLDDGSLTPEPGRPAGPKLKVRARVIMGGVEVKVVARGEPLPGERRR